MRSSALLKSDAPQADSGAFDHAVRKIKAQPIETDPFPHIYVEEIFPPAYYRAMLDRIAAVGKFVPTLYPGVAVDLSAKTFRDYGLTCENFEKDEELSCLHHFLKSDEFSRLLLEKFSASDSWGPRGSAIPVEKHAYFKGGQGDFTCVFDLHKDLPGYEISPHPDVTSKIVTFLFYFTPNDDLNRFGTMLCRVKPGCEEKLAHASRSKLSSLLLRATEPFVGKAYGLGQKDKWFPWDLFDVVKVAQAKPNSLLVFAPNSESYHAVRMDIAPDHPLQERQTLRGFIRSGKNSSNYVAGYSHGVGRSVMFNLARRIESLQPARAEDENGEHS